MGQEIAVWGIARIEEDNTKLARIKRGTHFYGYGSVVLLKVWVVFGVFLVFLVVAGGGRWVPSGWSVISGQ